MFFRCLEKVFEEERKKTKDGNSQGVTTSNKLVTLERDQNDEILRFDLIFVG